MMIEKWRRSRKKKKQTQTHSKLNAENTASSINMIHESVEWREKTIFSPQIPTKTKTKRMKTEKKWDDNAFNERVDVEPTLVSRFFLAFFIFSNFSQAADSSSS